MKLLIKESKILTMKRRKGLLNGLLAT